MRVAQIHAGDPEIPPGVPPEEPSPDVPIGIPPGVPPEEPPPDVPIGIPPGGPPEVPETPSEIPRSAACVNSGRNTEP